MIELIAYAADQILNVPKDDISYVILSGGRSESGFITFLFYYKSRPTLVAKIARLYPQKVVSEYNNLVKLSHLLGDTELSRTIEKPYALAELSGYQVLFKEFKEGVPGPRYLKGKARDKSKVRKFLSLSIKWLIDFVTLTSEHRVNSYEAKKSALQTLTGLHPHTYFEAIAKDEAIFVSPCHGDFVISNVLFDSYRESVNVIDFENFISVGFPTIDLISMIVDTGTTLFGLNDEMFFKTFLTRNWFSLMVKDAVQNFCTSCNIKPSTLISMVPLYSDRAIYLCKAWDMDDLLRFHEKLRRYLVDRQSEVIWQD